MTMTLRTPPRDAIIERQCGSAIVEFAIVAVLFFALLFGIIDFGRLLFAWNAATEATRFGARVAVVCDKATPDQVHDRMRKIIPELPNANIQINWYEPEGTLNNSCTPATCKGVEVRISGFTIPSFSFLPYLMPELPSFSTYLPRESMEATNAAGDTNPVCSL